MIRVLAFSRAYGVPRIVPPPTTSVAARQRGICPIPPYLSVIASSVLRSASARSIRSPFSRLVPGALLDMQPGSKTTCRAGRSSAAAYSSSCATAEVIREWGDGCEGESEAHFSLCAPRPVQRRILISFARRRLDLTGFPA